MVTSILTRSLESFTFHLPDSDPKLPGFDWKADLIFDLVSTYDVAFFQENLISEDGQIKSLSARWSGSSFWSPANGKQGGVCALFHHRFEGKCLSWRKDSSGCVISLLIDYLGSQIN